MGLQKYESKQVQINRPASVIYFTISNFNNFTPMLQDKVEGWSATEDSCTFKVKGFNLSLRMVDKIPDKQVKIVGEDGSPFDFTFWVQMKELAANDTRMRLVLHVELNMMMKMMVGGKLKDSLDQIADQFAASFNAAPI